MDVQYWARLFPWEVEWIRALLKHIFGLSTAVVVATACASIVGADFGDYRLRPVDGGATTAGGASNSGGTTSSGGTNGVTGGAVATGGSSSGGGTSASGGAIATGGIAGTGGTTSASNLSCAGMTGTDCNGESCCTALAVPGGALCMGRHDGTAVVGCPDTSDAYASGAVDELPEHSVALSTFALDKYEVTVGRFRKFVGAYDAWRSSGEPSDGAGVNPNITGTGWQKSAWDASLAADQSTLITNMKCNSTHQMWTDTAGANEEKAINCVDWLEAFAFCAWDGGWMPTEAEWEYAAAGGSENRLFPWGSAVPDCTYANMGAACGNVVDLVGSQPVGAGRWGHLDLVGNVYEWTFDWYDGAWYSNTAATGTNVADLTSASERSLRGGFFSDPVVNLRSARRNKYSPTGHNLNIGLRCARSGA